MSTVGVAVSPEEIAREIIAAHFHPRGVKAGLGSAIATAIRAAEERGREEAAKYHDDEADRIRNQCQWHGRDTAYIEAIGAHEEAASAIRSLKEKAP